MNGSPFGATCNEQDRLFSFEKQVHGTYSGSGREFKMGRAKVRAVVIFLCFFTQLLAGDVLLGNIRNPGLELSFYFSSISLIIDILGASAFTATLYFLSPIFVNEVKFKKFLSLVTIGFFVLSGYPVYHLILNREESAHLINLYYMGIGCVNFILAILCVWYLIRYNVKTRHE